MAIAIYSPRPSDPKDESKNNQCGSNAQVFWKSGKKGVLMSQGVRVKVKTVKELAEFLGLSARQVFRLKKEGVFENKDGYYDLKTCVQQYIKKVKAEKKLAKRERWLDNLSPDERAFYDSIPDVDINDFITPEQQKEWEDELAKMPTMDEIMAMLER